MSDVIVNAVDVTKVYRRGRVEVQALRSVSLQVKRGEIVGIMGPSGSGKTTLLNIIGGLDKPSSGRVFVDGVEITSLDEGKLAGYRLKRIGFVFQSYNLLPTLTALENVELPMALAGLPKAKRRERALKLLRMVGLEARAYHMPEELSGGEQQRVAVARALANNPSLVLADEPTGDLDSTSARGLMGLIEHLNRENRQTFIIVTHDPLVAERCSSVYHIRDGRIESL
ncbi:MAG: ABC transporter ATP-binding protein [Candidatus Nezhaarchaeota archaeon]|nr:ABC transporter ATP-binding protein [Candidatus Nezhaarchaeota archaeon]